MNREKSRSRSSCSPLDMRSFFTNDCFMWGELFLCHHKHQLRIPKSESVVGFNFRPFPVYIIIMYIINLVVRQNILIFYFLSHFFHLHLQSDSKKCCVKSQTGCDHFQILFEIYSETENNPNTVYSNKKTPDLTDKQVGW